VGCCTRDKLCDRCLEDTLAQLRGVAACRGENWANRVAARVIVVGNGLLGRPCMDDRLSFVLCEIV